MTDTQTDYAVKLFVTEKDIRRFNFSGTSFIALKEKILQVLNYSVNGDIDVQLKYLDNEGDHVLLTNDTELNYALAISQNRLLKIYVTKSIILPSWRNKSTSSLSGSANNITNDDVKMKKVKDLDARFISHETCPDNTEIPVNSQFTKSWRIRNTGSVRWPDGCYFLQIDRANDLSAPPQTPVTPVNPNEEAIVTVTLVTPNLPGLYQTFFKLCSPQGKKFGQRMRVQILSTSDSVICPDRIDRVWEQLEGMGFVMRGQRPNHISSLILKENCDISRIVRTLVNK
jgi:hypothetical protein